LERIMLHISNYGNALSNVSSATVMLNYLRVLLQNNDRPNSNVNRKPIIISYRPIAVDL